MAMPVERRSFLASLVAMATGSLGARAAQSPHPSPRPGVDGSKVLAVDQLDRKEAAPVFDQVRRIPEIADGIRCHCGCAERPGYRSLLSCFEGDGMAQMCEICQGQAKLAATMHRFRRSLDKIREAIDRQFHGPERRRPP